MIAGLICDCMDPGEVLAWMLLVLTVGGLLLYAVMRR